MKLCIVIQKLAGLSGGAERVTIELANDMAARGMDIEIITYERAKGTPFFTLHDVQHTNLFPKQTKNLEQSVGLEKNIRDIPDIYPISHLKWFFTYGAFIRKLKRYLKNSPPDVLLGMQPTGAMVAASVGKMLNRPAIGSIHNYPSLDLALDGRWDPNPVYRKRRLEALNHMASITVLQEKFRLWFPIALRRKVEVIGNPISPALEPLPAPERREKTILSVGRLVEHKRHAKILEAFERAQPQLHDWRLVIVGDGPEKQHLQDLAKTLKIEPMVDFRGALKNVHPEYLKAGMLCHASEFEGFGLTIAEALAHGLPVIGNADCVGASSLIVHEKNGLLIRDSDNFSSDLSTAIQRLAEGPGLRARLGRAGPSSVERFHPDIIYDTWESLICKIAANEPCNPS